MAVFLVPTVPGHTVPVEKSILLFGRHPDCDVVIKHSRKVSRKHCCLAVVNDEMFVRDMGSMNGVRVNGKRIRKIATIRLGDELAVGDVLYTLLDHRPEHQADSEPLPALDEMEDPGKKSGPVSPYVPADLDLSQSVPIAIPEAYASPGDELLPDDDADDIQLVDLDDD